MDAQAKKQLIILSIGQSVCSCVANVIHLCIPPIVKAAANASIAWYVMSASHFITVITAPLGAWVSHRIGIINTMRVYCWLFTLGALIWLAAKEPLRTLIPMILFIYTGHGFKMMESYVTHTSTKSDGGQSFWWFQSIAGVGILWATLLYPVIRTDIYPLVPLLTIWAMLILFIITFFIKQDTGVIDKTAPKKIGHQYLKNAFILPIQKGIHFIKTNHWYPIFYLWYAFFRWFVYTSLLFLIPLHLMDVKSGWFIEWLPLGIYELIVILFWWLIGILADKIDRRAFNILWWSLIIAGFIGMIFWNDTRWLITLGFVAWMGRNIMYSASTHVLAKHNIDRKEDPDFTAFQRSLLKVWSVIAPLILWPIYQRWWFTAWITTLSVLMCIVGVTMIARTIKLPKFSNRKAL
jgi:MFS family permease